MTNLPPQRLAREAAELHESRGAHDALSRDRLAHFKCPTSVEVVPELPRTATGKLQKFKLREQYWDGHNSRII